MRPSVFKDGLHYVSIIHECDGEIAPEATGEITLLTASNALEDTDFGIGTALELRSGPNVVAVGEVLEVWPVSTHRSATSPDGYEIRLLTE
jgi:hypothetical protein